MERRQVVNREQPSLASCGTFSGQGEVLAHGVREISTDTLYGCLCNRATFSKP